MIYSDANEKWAPVPVELYSKAYEVSNFGRCAAFHAWLTLNILFATFTAVF
jgi:hypothetical protein